MIAEDSTKQIALQGVDPRISALPQADDPPSRGDASDPRAWITMDHPRVCPAASTFQVARASTTVSPAMWLEFGVSAVTVFWNS